MCISALTQQHHKRLRSNQSLAHNSLVYPKTNVSNVVSELCISIHPTCDIWSVTYNYNWPDRSIPEYRIGLLDVVTHLCNSLKQKQSYVSIHCNWLKSIATCYTQSTARYTSLPPTHWLNLIAYEILQQPHTVIVSWVVCLAHKLLLEGIHLLTVASLPPPGPTKNS